MVTNLKSKTLLLSGLLKLNCGSVRFTRQSTNILSSTLTISQTRYDTDLHVLQNNGIRDFNLTVLTAEAICCSGMTRFICSLKKFPYSFPSEREGKWMNSRTKWGKKWTGTKRFRWINESFFFTPNTLPNIVFSHLYLNITVKSGQRMLFFFCFN